MKKILFIILTFTFSQIYSSDSDESYNTLSFQGPERDLLERLWGRVQEAEQREKLIQAQQPSARLKEELSSVPERRKLEQAQDLE